MGRAKPMPEGSGRIRCTECGATAAASGKGGPITLEHAPDCGARDYGCPDDPDGVHHIGCGCE